MRVFGLRLRPGETDRTLELLGSNKVAIGWSLAPSLINPGLSRQQFKEVIDAAYPYFNGIKLAASVVDTWRFLREMEAGDLVVIPRQHEIYFVRVIGPARTVPDDTSKDMLFQRDVHLLLDGLPIKRHALPQELQAALKFRHTTEDLSDIADIVLELINQEGSVGVMNAIETKAGIRNAIKAWKAAFAAVGRTNHGFSTDMIWVDGLGIWLAAHRWKRETGYRFWNGLGDRLGGREDRNLIVEINPPDGGLPGRFQGMVATDGSGNRWLLHSGELNVRSKRVQLRAELEPGILPSVSVQFSTGDTKEYYVVTGLDDSPDAITQNTKKFLDVCLTVRASNLPNSGEFLHARKKAAEFEESIGTTVVPPQPQKEIDRQHARVWHDLRHALKAKQFEVGYDRISALAPDMYTACANKPYLFEIKTSSGASDCLKGVGQLIVYERVLGSKYRKYMVLPGEVGKAFQSVFASLEIGVVLYKWQSGKAIFYWPSDFAEG